MRELCGYSQGFTTTSESSNEPERVCVRISMWPSRPVVTALSVQGGHRRPRLEGTHAGVERNSQRAGGRSKMPRGLDRTGRAARRTARIVFMNYSNNDKTSSAESGEGRPLVKENAGQSSTPRRRAAIALSQGLAGVRKATLDAVTLSPPLALESCLGGFELFYRRSGDGGKED